MTILQQDDSGIQFVYAQPQFTQQTLNINGKNYLRYIYPDAGIYSKPGEPEIPVQTFVFAVPHESDVTASIIAADFVEESDINLPPSPVLLKNGEVPYWSYPDNYTLSDLSQWFPANFFQLEDPAYMRDVRIIRIFITPIQYFPERRVVRRYNRIEIRLNFNRKQPLSGIQNYSTSGIQDEPVLKILQNPEQAKKWPISKKRAVLKKTNRFFNSSDYYKIPIQADGLYRITGQFLQNNGIDILSIDPATFKIFNNGGKVLLESLHITRPDSLIQNAIIVVDGGDGSFETGDYILFYGFGVTGWQYSDQNQRLEHYINPYTNSNIYWLTFNDGIAGKRIDSYPVPASAAGTVTTHQTRQFIDNELVNIFHSGTDWYGSRFDDQFREQAFSLDLKNLIQTNRVKLRVRLIGLGGGLHKFQFLFNGNQIGNVDFIAYNQGEYISAVEKKADFVTPLIINSSTSSLEINYTPASQVSITYLDWFEISGEADLVLSNNQLTFYSETGNQAVEYQIAGAAGSDYKIFDISNFSDIKQITDYNVNNGSINFKVLLSNDGPKKFAVTDPDQILSITTITKDEFSDLRNPSNGADFIIITHNDFYNAAGSLKNLRESHDGLQTTVVKITDVFDEFGAGLYDPTAIRDFLKYAYESWSLRPRYVLLLGDGDYDYKNLKSSNDSNWIPPYETDELSETVNRTSDDWFTYIHGSDDVMDYSIGRMPVQTTEEAEFVVDKLIEYSTDSTPGFWKNLFTIVADDEVGGQSDNETLHTAQAERIAENYVPKRFDLHKIYLTEYPVVLDASASWISKPGVTIDLINRINNGSLIINFIGHGNPHLWTHERIFRDSRDANKIQNQGRYAFWITATCDFGRWDDPENQSFAELLLLMEKRGAVSMLTSARLVYSGSNADFNQKFVRILLQNQGRSERVGDAMVLAKQISSNLVNREKFSILGDPTFTLAVPPYNVEITSLKPDSLKALSLITVQGDLLDPDGTPVNYNGKISLKTFDSRRDVTYMTKFNSPVSYKMPGNPIFRGSGSVENGKFTMQFIVPKDISYGGTSGRISLYFEDGSHEGAGYRDNLIVDGTSTNLIDLEGPEIEFETREQILVDFAVLNSSDVINIIIADDKSGINITGDVGHKITAIPDENSINQKEITDLFE